MAKKPVLTAAEAAKMIPDGATIMCGGFLACGQARASQQSAALRLGRNDKEYHRLHSQARFLTGNRLGCAVGECDMRMTVNYF